MNTTKQFWALLKFQMKAGPFIWFMPIAFSMPIFFPLIFQSVSGSPPDLDFLLSNQNMFFVGIFGGMLLAPERFQFGTNVQANASGIEFFLTRAVDRRILFRSKAAFFYLLVLILPLALFLYSLKDQDLLVRENSKIVQQQVYSHLPGSILVPDKLEHGEDILIPYGKVLVAAWRLWLFFGAAILLEVFALFIYPLKYRQFLFWTVIIFAGGFLPLLTITSGLSKQGNAFNNENLFFSYVAAQPQFLILAVLALITGHLWCERRFVGQEQ